MDIRENNLGILKLENYGVEERLDGRIDLYNDNSYLFVDQFNNHEELAAWISKNLTGS